MAGRQVGNWHFSSTPTAKEEIRRKSLSAGVGGFGLGGLLGSLTCRGQMDAAGDDSGNLGLMSVAKLNNMVYWFGDICIIRCR